MMKEKVESLPNTLAYLSKFSAREMEKEVAQTCQLDPML
jgi:hypothetical protein